MSNKEYTAESIQVLDDLQHMRLRRGMYIGSSNDPRQLLSEVIDNAIDEVQAGYSPELIVYVDTGKNEYSVRDFGRGIPHGKKKLENGEEKEILSVILTKANSGGKFNTDAYNFSSGLNGLGITITNALSTEIEIQSYRQGKLVKAVAHGSSDVDLIYDRTDEVDGTFVRFIPNPEYFHSSKIPVQFILDRCRTASALGYRARLIVDNEEVDTNATIFDLIKEEENNKVSTYVDIGPIEVTSSTKEKMKVALRYTSETNDRYFGFTNLLSNYLGGRHVQELSKIVTEAWKEIIRRHKNIMPAVELSNNDYLVGLRAVCAVFISKPEYSSQTKEKLIVDKKYLEELMNLFKDEFVQYLEDNILIAQQLLKRFEEYRISQNALLSRKEISSLIKVNNDSDENIRRRSVVSKLVECTSRKRKGTELFIVEGDSAKGPFMFTRNPELQAVLPLRGKILNVTNKSIKDAVKNSEICDIANSIGCGIGPSCDASKSRYERILLSSDADVDGAHITCLIASVFINLFPDMVKQGRVYITLPPLYCWGNDVKNYGWCNSPDEIPKGVTVTRFKGLGEMNQDQLKYFLVDPNTRREIRLDYPSDIDEFNRILGSAQGKHELLEEFGILCRGD